MPIKVLHVFSPHYKSSFGGPTFAWRFCFKNWNTEDVQHYILDTKKGEVFPAKEAFNFEFPEVQKNASRWERGVWILPLFWNLMKYKRGYDILYFHVLWWAGLLVGPWAKWNKIPALYESVLLDSDTPGGIYKTKLGKLKVRLLRTYKAILAISEALADDYHKYGFSAEQVFTLENCVDDKMFSPVKSAQEKISLRQKMNIPSDATVLVFVGSVIERKGVDLLIKAFIEASAKHSDLYLLVVGPKNRNEQPSLDEGFVDSLYSLLSQNDLASRVSFMGLVQDWQKLSEIYQASDIFVFPSRNEGLPHVVLEAMAAGLPVLVSCLPGLVKTIKHDENGLFVPIGDVKSLRDSILLLSENLTLAEKLGQNGRRWIEENHGSQAWQTQLVKIYRGLLTPTPQKDN